MADPVDRRVIVKLSGEALTGAQGYGVDQTMVERLALDLAPPPSSASSWASWSAAATSFAVSKSPEQGVPRTVGDTMGMLATVMNCLVLEAAIERAGREARTLFCLGDARGVRDL